MIDYPVPARRVQGGVIESLRQRLAATGPAVPDQAPGPLPAEEGGSFGDPDVGGDAAPHS